jgi:hypothetical protein
MAASRAGRSGALNGDLNPLVKCHGAKDSCELIRRVERTRRPLADAPLGATWEPTRSPSLLTTTRDHRTPTP